MNIQLHPAAIPLAEELENLPGCVVEVFSVPDFIF
jgi:hypothetical protein